MKKHGELTAEIANGLKFAGYDVYYDHGMSGDKVGKIVSTIEKEYGKQDELSQLDIAIVEQSSGKTLVLVEIEETSDRPKTFLGDIFGVLFGDHIFFKREKLNVGSFTTLIVVGISEVEHKKRNDHIKAQVDKIKGQLDTQNSVIGNVMIETYTDEKELSERLPLVLKEVCKIGL